MVSRKPSRTPVSPAFKATLSLAANSLFRNILPLSPYGSRFYSPSARSNQPNPLQTRILSKKYLFFCQHPRAIAEPSSKARPDSRGRLSPHRPSPARDLANDQRRTTNDVL